MNLHPRHIIPLALAAGAAVIFTSCTTRAHQKKLTLAEVVKAEDAKPASVHEVTVDVVNEPELVTAYRGDTVRITVSGPDDPLRTYQWYDRNGTRAMSGQTRKTLVLDHVNHGHADFYRCLVSQFGIMNDGQRALTNGPTYTRDVALSVSRNADKKRVITTVPGTPVTSAGVSGSCPGGYKGYVSYKKSVANGWGYQMNPSMPTYAAADPQRSGTVIECVSYTGIRGCGPDPLTVPASPNTKHRFTIYFPSSGPAVPTGSYSIELTNFAP